jgi:hypothetical protein
LDPVVLRRIEIVLLGKVGGMGVELLILDHVSYAIWMMVDPFLTVSREGSSVFRGRPYQCRTVKDTAI